MTDSFPRQNARTRGFNLGLPRAFTAASDGSRVAFLRSASGEDPAASLWVYDIEQDRERVVFDPKGQDEGDITAEERDRRERTGERLTGVAAYATDPAARFASFVVGDRLHLADLTGEAPPVELHPSGSAFDPRPNITASHVAYVAGGELRAIEVATGQDRLLASDEDPDVHWGLAEFIAAEEMARSRGYWWAPDGERLIAARVDEKPVLTWHISAPVDPQLAPRAVRYPQAGTANAIVTLHVLGLDGSRVDVDWDREAFEYVEAVSWTAHGPPIAMVQSRDQRTMRVLEIDPATGGTTVLWEDHDERWAEGIPGVPVWASGQRLVVCANRNDTRCLLIDGKPLTPPGLQVTTVADAGDVVRFHATSDPLEMHAWEVEPGADPVRLSAGAGVHAISSGGEYLVLTSESMSSPLPVSALMREGRAVHTFESLAQTPLIQTRPAFFEAGGNAIRTILFTPGSAEPSSSLPVLLDPYGGPHFARVVSAQRAHLLSQWLADQGFAVIVADGRGTPNRGMSWEQSVYRDYVDAALEDQIEALHAAAERYPFLDLSKVAIRGWSYGGYLVCAAMLRRPDVFRAGIAGAPVTDMRYYDTYYSERFLGTPESDPAAYENADVVKDAAALEGELMILHGVADDNVYFVHSLRMSRALMEAGRRHTMIPLSGVTHRTVDETAAENMLLIQVDFLRRALDVGSPD